jgi:hypothetical protein
MYANICYVHYDRPGMKFKFAFDVTISFIIFVITLFLFSFPMKVNNNITWEFSCVLCTVHTVHLPQGPRNQSSAAQRTEGKVWASPWINNQSPLLVGRGIRGLKPLEQSVPVVPCVVAQLHSRITLPFTWHWIVCCMLRVI